MHELRVRPRHAIREVVASMPGLLGAVLMGSVVGRRHRPRSISGSRAVIAMQEDWVQSWVQSRTSSASVLKRVAYVHEAAISLGAGTDPGEVGAAVTIELCGGAEHDGPCPWPHNNAIDPSGDVAVFRTLFLAPESDEQEVRTRIQSALRSSDHWLVRFSRPRPLQFAERALATRLASTAVVSRG